jgi:hypothetical protein
MENIRVKYIFKCVHVVIRTVVRRVDNYSGEIARKNTERKTLTTDKYLNDCMAQRGVTNAFLVNAGSPGRLRKRRLVRENESPAGERRRSPVDGTTEEKQAALS